MKLLKKRRFIGPEGYVFGDATGELVEDIKKAWNTLRPGGRIRVQVWMDGQAAIRRNQTALKTLNK